MGFFDALIVPPAQEQPSVPPQSLLLHRWQPGLDQYAPPQPHFVPARMPWTGELGASQTCRVVLTGVEVWPAGVSLRITAFTRQVQPGRRGRHHLLALPAGQSRHGDADGLRFGVRLADGRRATILDPEPYPPVPPRAGVPPRATLRPYGGFGAGFYHHDLALYLSVLPPEGLLTVVVHWPAESIPETHTDLNATALRAATAEVIEVWPDLPEMPPESDVPTGYPMGVVVAASVAPPAPRPVAVRGAGPAVVAGAAPAVMPVGRPPLAVPPLRPGPEPARSESARSDWDGPLDWSDPGAIRARLDAGADPDAVLDQFGTTALHRAAIEWRGSEAVAELAARATNLDPQAWCGVTPLWEAVRWGRAATVAVLIGYGADPWRPVLGGRSAGRQALVTELAPLVARLPGAVPLTERERAEQERADALIAGFQPLTREGLGVAFVAGVDDEEVVRRLGLDPADWPVLDLDTDLGPYGTGPDGFDPHDFDEARQHIGITPVDGGCVLFQPLGHLPSDGKFIERLSRGTIAFGVFDNPKGGVFTALGRDGEVSTDEAGRPGPEDPPEAWLYRLGELSGPTSLLARTLAYGSALTGVRLPDPAVLAAPPRRWVRMPD